MFSGRSLGNQRFQGSAERAASACGRRSFVRARRRRGMRCSSSEQRRDKRALLGIIDNPSVFDGDFDERLE
jgi:hypothetical protein